MSPERIHEHDLGYDFRSDIWSLGCILYEVKINFIFIKHLFILFIQMSALRSPFYGENLNLILLRKKIEALDYAPLPANIFSHDVRIQCLGNIYLFDFFSFVILLQDVLY